MRRNKESIHHWADAGLSSFCCLGAEVESTLARGAKHDGPMMATSIGQFQYYKLFHTIAFLIQNQAVMSTICKDGDISRTKHGVLKTKTKIYGQLCWTAKKLFAFDQLGKKLYVEAAKKFGQEHSILLPCFYTRKI